MGFRNKHRRGRGGGGGGGGHHHHHHGFGTGEPNGLQPGDDIGNRKSFKAVQHPPDDLGNRKDPDEVEFVPVDDVGNRVDAAPTHEMSGTLMDVDGKGRRRRRPKGVAAPERVGRFFVGGVNPLIATNTPRPFPGKTLEESFGGPGPSGSGGHHAAPSAHAANDDRGDDMHGDGARDDMGGTSGASGPGDGPRDDGDFEGEGGGRRRRRRGRGGRGGEGRFEQVDGVQAQEVSERRAQRFFDFDEDDRFEYTLKTTAEQKRKDAEDAVKNVVTEAGRDGVVLARLIEDGTRPKVLVTIDERGPAASVPPERRAHNAHEPLFVMGNAALMSLNYLVNKIVNRYPDDRIRLAILPAADERLYLDALADHQKLRRAPGAPGAPGAPTNGAAASTSTAASNASMPTPVVATPQPSAPRSVPAVATPAPIGPAAPPEAFDEAMEKPKPVAKEPELAKAEERIAEKVKHLEKEQSEADERDESEPDESEDEDEGEDNEGEADDSIDSKPKATPKKKAKAAPKKKAAAEKPAAKKAAPKKAAKKAPVVEKAVVKKR